MHKGKTHAADSISTQISRKIVAYNAFSVERGSRELWQTVRELTVKNKQANEHFPVDAGTLNEHYATISTDQNYSLPLPKLTVNKFTEFLTEQSVFQLLDTTGLDEIPSWFLRIAAPLISEPTAYIFNWSLSYSVVPRQWKTAQSRRSQMFHSRRLAWTSGQSLLLQSSPD